MTDVLDLVNKERIKRLFRAREKISFPGAVCHIIQRGTGKEPLFLEEGDYLYMLRLIKDKAKKFTFGVFCHCLMPNHLHLLIRLFKDNLSKAMKQLYGEYASFFNKKYERKGHVFGGAFRQALCFDESYLLVASVYIHLNPVKANLIDDPAKYRWSSCRLYAESFNGKTFVNYKFILQILDKDIVKAQRLYKEMLDKAKKVEVYQAWENSRALEFFKIKAGNFLPKIKTKGSNETIDENFLDEEKLEEKISELKLKGRLRCPETLKARNFLIEQLRARGYTMGMISEKFGISRQAIYKQEYIRV